MMRRYLHEVRGAAAVEFALWLGVLTLPTLNVIDLGYYAFQAMQVRQAAQAGAESAIACATTLPAATNCSTLSSAITTAAQSTSLGTAVTVSSATTSTFEGYYCSNTTGGLTKAKVSSGTNPWSVTATSTPPEPTSCSSTVTGNSKSVGDYVAVTTSYTFHPIFGSVTITSLLPSTITQQAWMRLG